MRALLTLIFTTLFFSCTVMMTSSPASANVENFSYESWHSEVHLSVDDDGRATALVTETLVVLFPEVDQNRGIIRGLPLKLHGAPAAPENITVTDESGNATPFFIEEDDDFRAILTGDDDYVHGRTTYVIAYTIADPIFQPSDASIDEFYWDMVSVDRLQPIESFTASIHLDETLADAFNGNASAYGGSQGSTETIPVTHQNETFTLASQTLGPDEVVTMSLGFAENTVTQPNSRVSNFALDGLPIVISGAGLATSIFGLFGLQRLRKQRRSTGRAIIAQYDVPATMPPLLAAQIRFPKIPDAIAPQFLHLAVAGYMRIEERLKSDGSLPKKPRPVFRNLSPHIQPATLTEDPLNTATLSALFTNKHPEEFELPKSSTKFANSMTKLVAKARTESDARGFFTKERSRIAVLSGVIGLVLAGVAVTIMGISLVTGFAKEYTTVALVIAGCTVPFMIANFMRHRVHTDSGAEMYEYLEGVELFIKVAEADRIQMLQSHDGAERYSDNGVEVLQLYERLLPYAVLFGLEKQWSKVLQTQYEAQHITSPYWYPYLATRGIGSLSDTVTNITGRVASAASYTASSSSGSSGGGFAGGGGGGGFSGGR